jgi:hypothetical protein
MTTDHSHASPPRWAKAVLGLLLTPEDRERKSGDLVERYRERIIPSRGSYRADAWYVTRVAGVVWRAAWIWAVVFSGAFLARTLYDWLVPTNDFAVRAMVSTWCGVSTLFIVGFWAAWRSREFVAAPIAAVMTSQIAAVMSVMGAAILLAIWHDPQTRQAIADSGGLDEVFLLPFMMIVPAVFVGTLGGAASRLVRRLR